MDTLMPTTDTTMARGLLKLSLQPMLTMVMAVLMVMDIPSDTTDMDTLLM